MIEREIVLMLARKKIRFGKFMCEHVGIEREIRKKLKRKQIKKKKKNQIKPHKISTVNDLFVETYYNRNAYFYNV